MGIEWRKLMISGLMEMLGTFVLLHSYSGANNTKNTNTSRASDPLGYSLLIGITYMLLIQGLKVYANPAVCLAAAFRGTLDFVSFGVYFLCQFIGGYLGVIVSNEMYGATTDTIFGGSASTSAISTGGIGRVMYFEGFYAIVVCLISLRSDDINTNKDESHDNGNAIACAYMVGVYLFGAVTGGIFNPAVAVSFFIARITRGPKVASISKQFGHIWIHLMAPFAAAVAAAFILFLGDGQIFWKGKAAADDDA